MNVPPYRILCLIQHFSPLKNKTSFHSISPYVLASKIRKGAWPRSCGFEHVLAKVAGPEQLFPAISLSPLGSKSQHAEANYPSLPFSMCHHHHATGSSSLSSGSRKLTRIYT